MLVKGALHLHSHFSYDAKLSLPELRGLFRAQGLHFALMTEHTDELTPESAEAFMRACREASDAEFLFVPGFEVPYRYTHVLMVGATRFVQGGPVDAAGLQAWRSACSFAVLAHPHRNAFEVDDDLREVIDGIEIWNSQYDGKQVPRTSARRLYRSVQSIKPDLLAWGGWDFHRASHAGGPVIVTEIKALTVPEVLGKLQGGFFSSVSASCEITSRGTVVRGYGAWISVQSALFVTSITFLKWVNKCLHKAGLRAPRSVTQYLRAKL